MMQESALDILKYFLHGSKHASATVHEARDLISNLKTIINKPIEILSILLPAEQKTVNNWATAFLMLKRYPHAYNAFQRLVKRVVFLRPDHGEDAAWQDSNDTMYLYTLKAGYNPQHMLNGLVHEIGHAIEDTDHSLHSSKSLFFKPPYANDYCANDGEDFAESYMVYILEPEYCKRAVPAKYSILQRL